MSGEEVTGGENNNVYDVCGAYFSICPVKESYSEYFFLTLTARCNALCLKA